MGKVPDLGCGRQIQALVPEVVGFSGGEIVIVGEEGRDIVVGVAMLVLRFDVLGRFNELSITGQPGDGVNEAGALHIGLRFDGEVGVFVPCLLDLCFDAATPNVTMFLGSGEEIKCNFCWAGFGWAGRRTMRASLGCIGCECGPECCRW